MNMEVIITTKKVTRCQTTNQIDHVRNKFLVDLDKEQIQDHF